METFDQIKNQKRASSVLQRAILADRVSHAWLLCGSTAKDRSALALAFAAALLCTDRSAGIADACLHCTSCLQAAGGNHPDIRIWNHKNPKNYTIEEVRSLAADVSIRPFRSGRKIYIVTDAHLLRPESQNALLKTLEEPPEYVVILLLAQSEDAMLETIRSRCQTLELTEGRPDYNPQMYRILENLLLHLSSMNLFGIRSSIAELEPYKVQADSMLTLFVSWFRDILYTKASRNPEGLLFPEHAALIEETSCALSFEEIQHVLDTIHLTSTRLKANVKFDLAMELLLLTIKDAYASLPSR